jgi:hypothetical protein
MGAPDNRDDLVHWALVGVLEAAVGILEHRGDLVARVRSLIHRPGAEPQDAKVRFMSLAEYARHARVSERTLRYQVKRMTEHVHFHRDGCKRRRIVIHVREADEWRATQGAPGICSGDIDRLAIDEVTRRRARAALRKHNGTPQ